MISPVSLRMTSKSRAQSRVAAWGRLEFSLSQRTTAEFCDGLSITKVQSLGIWARKPWARRAASSGLMPALRARASSWTASAAFWRALARSRLLTPSWGRWRASARL